MVTSRTSSVKTDKEFQNIQKGTVNVPGGKVWYRMVGAQQKGTPLLVLHGGPGAPHDYLEPLEALANEHPVIFYDQLGCGNSNRPSDRSLWTTARFVEEVDLVRAALKLDQIHLLGQSWGAMLAVEYLLRKKPERIVSLILSGPYLSTPRWIADQQKWIEQLPEAIQQTIRKYEALEDYASPEYQEAMIFFYKRHLCRVQPLPECMVRTFEKTGTDVYNYLWGYSEFTMTGTLKEVDLTERLPEIDLPVLFTCGEYDEATPAATALFQSKIAGSEMYIFRDASHSHHLEKPEEYIRVVRDFLKRKEHKTE
ncbi:MAG TPA: proline iminopeptidase-family hydrolase [Prolixibacteraceae bacterium]|nr:proline iminopeptidase-family hydrolase [Prolixibacteraceae bacterium]